MKGGLQIGSLVMGPEFVCGAVLCVLGVGDGMEVDMVVI